ncbi:MAG: hypothetical protein JSW71_15850 [Gemmatimonadota bacterium]|nr:MAG: hypothetical protein JSW71_15850 [Gemmatimonadota bacterium]
MSALPATRDSWLAHLQSVHVAAWMALGGAAYMLGNLVLAGILAPEDFGRLVLFQAMLGLGVSLAPLGLDSLVVRRELWLDSPALRMAALAGSITAVAFGIVAVVFFGLALTAVSLLAPAILVATTARMCAASEQARLRLGKAQLLAQLPSLWFGVGAVALAALDITDWHGGAAALASGYALAAAWGMGLARGRIAAADLAQQRNSFDRATWNKALSLVGILASVLLLHQIERLVIPARLGLAALANFAVIATVVGSPYRVLHGGIAYALMPRMRSATTGQERRRLVRTELLVALLLGSAGGGALALAAGPLIHALYGTKYDVPLAVVIAIALVGVVRLIYAVAAATVSAMGEQRQLRRFNALGWVSTAVATIGTIVLCVFGILGAVLGAGIGWTVRLVAAGFLAQSALRSGHEAEPDAHVNGAMIRTD